MEDLRAEKYETELFQEPTINNHNNKLIWLLLFGILIFSTTFGATTWLFDLNPIPVKLVQQMELKTQQKQM